MISRKLVWSVVSLLIVALLVAACGATPEVSEVVVTQIVKETVIVEGTPQVVEKEVTKVVEVEKEVTVVETVEVEKQVFVAGEGPVGGTLVAGALQGMEPASLNPNFRRDDGALRVAALVYCQLLYTDYSHGTGVYPDLADSWDVNEDMTEITFHLAKNATWHDGEPVTSADVVWSLNETIDKEGGGADYLAGVKSIEAPDDYTVVITLNEPDAAFLSGLGYVYGPKIMPAHLFEGTDWSTSEYNNEPVGCGPFKFVDWQKGSHIEFEANEDYYRGRPHLDRLFMRFYTIESLMSAYEAGDVKYSYDNFPISEAVRLQQDPKYRIEPSAIPLVYWFGFNLAEKPFDDVRVRRAFALAIDREDISQRVFQGIYPASYGQMPKGWAYNSSAETEYNPELAMQLLDEAGLTPDENGVRLETVFDTAAVMSFPDAIEVMREHLKDVGIEITVSSTDWAGYVEKVIEQRNYLVGFGGGLAGPEPAAFEPFVMTDGYRNLMGYSNPRVDELMSMARTTMDETERKKYYYEVQEILAEELPRVTFLDSVQAFPRWSSVKNAYFDKELVGRPSNMD